MRKSLHWDFFKKTLCNFYQSLMLLDHDQKAAVHMENDIVVVGEIDPHLAIDEIREMTISEMMTDGENGRKKAFLP